LYLGQKYTFFGMKVFFRNFLFLFISLQANLSVGQQLDWKDSLIHFKESGDLMQFYKLLETKSSQGLVPKYFLKDLGYYFLNSGRFEEAITVFTECLEFDHFSPDLYLNRGIAYWNRHLYDSANLDFSEALWRSRSDDSLRYIIRANIYSLKAEYQEAKLYLDSAISFNKNNSNLFYQRSKALYSVDDLKNALLDANIACRLVPRSMEVYLLRANIYLQLNRIDDAMNDCRIMERISPENWYNKLLLGQIYLRKNEPDTALIYLNKIPESVESADVYYCMAAAYSLLTQYNKAILFSEKAMRVTDNSSRKVYCLILISRCKDILNPGSGCDEIKQAYKLGSDEAGRLIEEYCH